MAVLAVEIFADTDPDAAPLSPLQQYDILQCFTRALAPLTEGKASALALSVDIITHDTGAFITALCLADSGATASEAMAEHLTASLNERTDPDQWELRAGLTHVISSDN